MDWLSFIFGILFVIVVEFIIIITILIKSFNNFMSEGKNVESNNIKNSSNE